MSGPVVVSDTSPINYLILTEAVELLPRVFSRIIVPTAVGNELADPKRLSPCGNG
jgi:predicted nucleic acid-binding protein